MVLRAAVTARLHKHRVDYFKCRNMFRKLDNLSYSLGLTVDHKGAVTDVAWDGPAFNAGITVGSEIVSVNGTAFDADNLKDAVMLAKDGTMRLNCSSNAGTVTAPSR